MDMILARSTWPVSTLPGWALAAGRNSGDMEAAFAAGVALKALDDLVKSEAPWAGCWRDRQALKSAAATVRFLSKCEDDLALRDAVMLSPVGADPGPAGQVYWGFRRLASGRTDLSQKAVADLALHLGVVMDEPLQSAVSLADTALRNGGSAPFAAAAFIGTIYRSRPDAEPLALALGDILLATSLKWPNPVPLLSGERHGPAFRSGGSRGRVMPGDSAFPRAICLAVVDAANGALRSASEIARRAETLLAVAPRIRTKGADAVFHKLLNEDAVAASASGTGLSRWAATRLFERLQSFHAVRELSGRSTFRIYGL